MFPTLDVEVLRGRLDVSAAQVSDATLEAVLATTRAVLDPRVDPRKFPDANAAYLEGCYQFAVKVYQTGNQGIVASDPLGGYDFGAVATHGMWRSVIGVMGPCLYAGGVVGA